MNEVEKMQTVEVRVDSYQVKRLVKKALSEMSGDYADSKGRFKNLPLYFFWGYFRDYYSDTGCLMKYCHYWGFYYAEDLTELTKEEFFITWIDANKECGTSEGAKIVWNILSALRMSFKPKNTTQRKLYDLVIEYKGGNSERAKELLLKLKRKPSLLMNESRQISNTSWKAYSDVINSYPVEKCI